MLLVSLFNDVQVKFCLMIIALNGGYDSRFDVKITIRTPSSNFCNLLRLAWG